MTIEERVELYKSLYKECKALEPVANTLAKGYKQADPDLEAFLHQFRHHLQNEARELSRKYLLMEDDPKADYRIPYREANSMLYGEDDAVAWSRFLIENC